MKRIRCLQANQRLLTDKERLHLEILHLLSNDGNTEVAIAEHLGVPESTVRFCVDRFWRNGIDAAVFHKSAKFGLNERRKLAKEMKLGQRSLRNLAASIPLSHQAIAGIIARVPYLDRIFRAGLKVKAD